MAQSAVYGDKNGDSLRHTQMKSGFSALGLSALRARRMVVTRSMQRVGLQRRWKDLEKRRVGGRESVVRRSLGVVYLKARFWEES